MVADPQSPHQTIPQVPDPASPASSTRWPSPVPELAIVVPVFNEEKHIASLVKDWKTTLDGIPVNHGFIFIDDGSTDDSARILQSLSQTYPDISFHSQTNAGHGPAILNGYAMAENFRWVFQVDSDHQWNTNAFETLWRDRDQYDLLLGERLDKFASPARRIVSLVSGLAVNILFGNTVKDVNSPYRLMRGAKLQEALKSVPSGSFAPNILLTSWFIFSKGRIFRTPVGPNRDGVPRKSTLNVYFLKGCFRSLLQTIRFRFKLWNTKSSHHPE